MAMNEFDKLRGEKSTLSINPIKQPESTTSSTYVIEEDSEPIQSFQKPRENPFDLLEKDRTALDESLYEHSRYIASQRDAARMGEAMRTAPEFGMDPGFVYENLDTIKKERAPFAPFSMLNKDYPNTVNLLKDPNFATLLKNEVENLKKVEEATKEYGFASSFSKSLTGGLAGFGSRLAGSVPMLYDSYRMARNKTLEKITGKKVEELPSWVVGMNKRGDEIWDENSGLSQIEYKLREKQKEIQKPIQFDLGGSFLDLMADGEYGKAAKTLVMQAANNAPNSLVAIGSVLTGAPAVGLLGIGATAAAGKEEDLKESQPGLDEETRLLNATLTGGVEATTEMIGALLPFAQAMKPVNQIIGKQFGKEAAKAVSREFFKTILVATGSGFAEEAAATIGEATVDYSTNVNKDAFNNILKDTLNSGISGAFSGGAMTGPAALSGAAFRSRTLMQAQAGYNFWMSLGDATARNETLKDMPEAKAKALQELTKNGNVENAFIDMKGFVELFQKKGIDPAKAAQQLGISKEFSEASEAGTDITVKTADVAAKLVGTEEYSQIAEHVKFDADGTTIAQEREDQALAQETMAGVEQELKEIESESVDDPAKMINSVFVEEGKEIARIVKEQVKQAGRSAQEASKSGQLYEAFFRTLSKRDESGRTPLQLFNQYNLRIRRMNAPTAVSGQTLNQIKEFKDAQGFPVGFAKDTEVDQKEFKLKDDVDVLKVSNLKDVSLDKARADANKLASRGVFTNKHTGEKLKVNADTVRKAINQGNKLIKGENARKQHFAVLQVMKQLAENAVYLTKDADQKDRGGQWKYYFAPIEIDGVLKNVKLEVNSEGLVHAYAVVDSDGGVLVDTTSGKASYPTGDKIQIKDFSALVKNDRAKYEYFQNADDPMGRIVFGKDGVNIDLFKKADPSTMIHESGHFFLKVMKDVIADGSASDQLQADYKAIWKWLGAEEGSELTVEQEEKWARGIEAYVMEGKAPSTALQKAFKFFENWLKVLYQKAEALGVEINPEIRGVMDRLFATQEEIEIAESNYTDLMAESSDLLSPSVREKYAKLKEQARDEAENKLKSKLMESQMQKMSEGYKKQQAEVRELYLAEINESEFQQAIGKMLTPEGIKIDPNSLSEELKGRMPTDVLSAEGMPVEVIASSMGYNTTAEFVDAFEAAYTERTTGLDTRVEQEMQRRFPDSIFEISDQALEAVHNEYKSKIHALEFEFLQENAKGLTKDLTKQVIRRGKTTEFLKSRAEALIDEKNFKELKPYLYERAERKAAKEAADAFAKKDIDGALKAKEREVLAHEMFKKAVEAERFYKDKIKDTKKFSKSDKDLSATRDTDFINAARAILARYGLNRKQDAAQDYLKKLSEYAPEIYNGLNSIMESVYVGAKDYKEVSYKQFKEMMNVVDALWELSRSSRQITIDGKKLDLNEVKQELVDQLSVLTETKKAQYTKTASEFDKFKTKFLGAKASMKRMEAWVDAIDLKYGGPFRKYIWEPVSKAVTTYRLEKQKVLQTYKNLLEGHVAKFEVKEIVSSELGHTFRNKAELLMAVLHSGNESNLSKLLRGRGWGEKDADGVLDTSRWDVFIARMQREGVLTKEDYDFAQSIWDLMESFKPITQQAHKAMYGYFFSEITAQEISTPWGKYKGGYIPAKVDTYTNEDAELRNERQEFEQNNAAWSFPTTGKGATMSRVESYAAPLSLDMNLLGAHLDWALRFAYIEPTVKEVARIVYAKDFRESLRAVDPEIAKFGLVPWLKRTATQQVVTPSQSGILKATDWVASKVRSNMAMQIMMGNVSNALQQITGFSVAMSVVKPHQFAKSLVQYMQNPRALVEEISAKSKWFASTQDSNLYETIGAVQTILANPNVFQKATDFSKKHTYFLQTFTQNMVNTITWQAAYNQAVEGGMSEPEAVQFADSAVRRTQGSVSPEDISDFETGTPTARMFTQFVGYFNMLYNLMSTEYFKAYKGLGLKRGAGRMFTVTFFAFTMPAVMSELIVRAMAGKPLDEDDDEEYLNDVMKVFFGSQAKTALAMVPYLGQFGAAGYNQLFTKEQWDDRVSLSPAIGAAETGISAGVNLYKLAFTEDKVSTKKATKDALTTIGVFTGLPAGVLGKPAGYLIDLEEGKIEEPESTLDFTRGLITGKGQRAN